MSEHVRKKSLRVALIASEHVVCEYSMFLERLLVGLADESVPVALVCPPDCRLDTIFTGTAEIIRHPVFDLPLMGRLNLRLLVERFGMFNPTILHCLCETQAALTSQLARRLDLPFVLTVNSLQKRRSALPMTSPHCARVVVPAKSIADNLAGLYPHFVDMIQQINIGTFVADTGGCFSSASAVPTMVVAHPVEQADALENLFGVAKHLLIDGYEFMMVVVGGARVDRQLWKLSAALDLLPVVTLVPSPLPWRSVLASGDIFIRPRPSRCFDPVLLEAMSVGTAVAGCKGGVDDLIIENQTAVVFDPDDEQSIMQTLKQLLDRRELACRIARSAKDYLRQNYTVSGMVSDIFQVYRNLQG